MIMVADVNYLNAKRKLGMRVVFWGTVYEISRDGKLTRADAKPLAIGALTYLAMSEPFIVAAGRWGLIGSANTLLSGIVAIWAAGMGISYLIDGKEGVENFTDFLENPSEMPEKWYFTVDTLMNAGWKEWKEKYTKPKSPKALPTWTTDTPITEDNYLEIGGGVMGAHYISPQVAEGILTGYVFDIIMNQGYSYFEAQGVGIPPWDRMTAWKLALSQGQITIDSPIYGG